MLPTAAGVVCTAQLRSCCWGPCPSHLAGKTHDAVSSVSLWCLLWPWAGLHSCCMAAVANCNQVLLLQALLLDWAVGC